MAVTFGKIKAGTFEVILVDVNNPDNKLNLGQIEVEVDVTASGVDKGGDK